MSRNPEPSFDSLSDSLPLPERLAALHARIRGAHPAIARVSVVLVDPATRRARTYAHSTDGAPPLAWYEADLDASPSLAAVVDRGRPRVLDDLTRLAASRSHHTHALIDHGFRSSYTLPVRWNGTVEVVVFFNARVTHAFTPDVVADCDVIGHLAAYMVIADLAPVRALVAALQTTSRILHFRDPETGDHVQRMASFSRIIALDLARRGTHRIDDTWIERLYLFAPLHDVGKIAIPDDILLKPGELDPRELQQMRDHPTRGREIVDAIVANFNLGQLEHIDLLRQIAEMHHEALDGSGYPQGLRGAAIPLGPRIVATADVFDALTSRRPYKVAWPVDIALDHLRHEAGAHLDVDCVEALARNLDEVRAVQAALPG